VCPVSIHLQLTAGMIEATSGHANTFSQTSPEFFGHDSFGNALFGGVDGRRR